nr:MAG TPA: hypothetical protein [Caudoviricetes sp.]
MIHRCFRRRASFEISGTGGSMPAALEPVTLYVR